MLLGLTPAWFLSSRTGFEYTLQVTLFTGFIYYYLLYRLKEPKYLVLSLILGGLAFYSYTPGQVIMVAIGLMLLASDWRYHWQQRKFTLPGLGLIFLLALPLFRFILDHPEDYFGRLAMYNSYWVGDGTTFQKIGSFFNTWLSGLNPFYWFFPNSTDLPVYTLKGYGNIALPFLPFVALGTWHALRHWRQSEYRSLFLCILAAPMGAALVSIDANRALVMVIPVILLTVFGLELTLDWVKTNLRLSESLVSLALFLVLSITGFWMLRDTLVNGPTWFSDYGLSGMQYGARQVFLTVEKFHEQNPGIQIFVSPNWSFQTPLLARFFLPPGSPILIGTADAYMQEFKPDIAQTLFVLTPKDYQKVVGSGFFKEVVPELVIPFPDGNPGFYFVQLQYKDNIQQIFTALEENRHQLVYSTVTLDGQSVRVGYSALDMGPIGNAFDGDHSTLIKSKEANPLSIELEFPQGRLIRGVTASVGAEAIRLTVYLYGDNGNLLQQYSTEAGEVTGYKDISLDFGSQFTVMKLRIEILDILVSEPSNVHIWDIKLN